MAISADKTAQQNFDLHVNLIMYQDTVAKSKALVRAWSEGPEGLKKRLGPVPATSQGGSPSGSTLPLDKGK